MEYIKDINKLNWEEVASDTPLACNWCSNSVRAGGFAANIKVSDDSDFMFVVCSPACRRRFVTHPLALNYMNDQIQNYLNE